MLCFKLTYNSTDNATNATTTSTRTYLFKTEVDRYSRLKLSKISSLLNVAAVDSAVIQVQFQNVAGDGTAFTLYSKANKIKRNFLSIVLYTEEGVYQSVEGDNKPDETCTSSYNDECYDSTSSGFGTTDVGVYVSWKGTDFKGKQYLSQAMRLSRFNLYSVTSAYNTVRNTISIQ